jgi:type III pantothenate kinase
MRQGLEVGTRRVKFDRLDNVGIEYGVTTSGCVQAGVNFALISILEGLHARMEGEGVSRMILTGGDGGRAASFCEFAEYCPDLVLDGLSLVGEG